jgi:sarcosine oxidase subunit gamma
VNKPELSQSFSSLTLQDFSALPRFGLKGINTQAWLKTHNYCIGDESNKAYPQDDGCLVARLSRQELLFLCDPEHPVLSVDLDYFTPGRDCYPIRRQDSHYWFAISGKDGPTMLAKLCGVNFEADSFDNHRVAQTQVASTSAIVMRNDCRKSLCYYLLGDNSYCTYMKRCVLDAMEEFGGRMPVMQSNKQSTTKQKKGQSRIRK